MEERRIIDIEAPPENVWEVMADVKRWPEWTPTVSRVDLLDGGPLRPGLRARLTMPGAPTSTWEVTDVRPGQSFTWESKAPGVKSAGIHVIEPRGTGSRVTLGVAQTGPGTWLLRPWLRRLNVRNLRLEGEGLKRAAEARAIREPAAAPPEPVPASGA